MYNNNMYSPYYKNYYEKPFFNKQLQGMNKKSFTWDGFLNNAHRTLNVINEALPIYKEVQPMFKNMGTLFKVLGEINAPSTISNVASVVTNTPTFFT